MTDITKKPRTMSFLMAELEGREHTTNLNMTIGTDDVVPYFLATNPTNKAAVTLEQLFVPIASRSGQPGLAEESNIPFLTCTNYITNQGPTAQTGWAGVNSSAAHDGIISEVAYLAGGVARGECPSIGSGNIATETMHTLNPISGDIRRGIGMRMPMLAAGIGIVVSGSMPGVNNAIVGYTYRGDATNQQDFSLMKAGPVDLRWDDRKQAWVGSDLFSSDIIYGYLSSNIYPPVGRLQYNEGNVFTVDTIVFTGSKWESTGKRVSCVNMDPGLSITGYVENPGPSGNIPNLDIFVAAMRIQSPTFANGIIYMPLYVGCGA